MAKLVEADCRNVGALMGTAISAEQIERLAWIRTRVGFPHILLFLDRDQAGQNAMRQARERLRHHNLAVSVFDWDQEVSRNGQAAEPSRTPSRTRQTCRWTAPPSAQARQHLEKTNQRMKEKKGANPWTCH